MSERDRRLTRVVHQHLGFVERVLRNLGVADADLDDAAQRTFIVFSDRLDGIVEGAEKSFLFTSARHMASHFRRSAKRRPRYEPLDDELPSSDDDPEQLVSQKDARQLLDELLDTLPEELRVVLSLYEFEELRMPEIAAMLGIPTGTVASRVRRARQAFQAAVRRLEAASEFNRPRVSSIPFTRSLQSTGLQGALQPVG
jgi:RNA polymerase sigma-70 factor (ECF subfamily)